jgi:hypothetical protein
MSPPLKNGALRGLGEPTGVLLAVDPGKRTGVCVYSEVGGYRVNTAALDELPGLLHTMLAGRAMSFVIVENFMLQSRSAVQQSGSDMPSSQGIGMCRVACEWTGTEMVLVTPQIKRAGHMSLDARGLAAWQAARNDHERDAVDIMGYALREMRRKP